MNRVIVDCDNTLGLEYCDVDDGLMLLFLLGSTEVEVLGVTLTYGNSELESVVKASEELVSAFNLGVPFYVGARNNQEWRSPASRFLAEMVAQAPTEITVIATGALTNLLGAFHYNPDFFSQVKEIITMGGVTHPLEINGQLVQELNFSCDPQATKAVLLSEAPLTIMTGHLTAQAYFPRTLIEHLTNGKTSQTSWLTQVLHNWCDWNLEKFGLDGFCNWDMTTALYLQEPELFSNEKVLLSQHQEFEAGIIKLSETAEQGKLVTMPMTILDSHRFNNVMIQIIQGRL